MKRVLICGDRNWKDCKVIEAFIKNLPEGTIIIQGMCRGADLMARCAAIKHGFTVEDYPANWDEYGRAAGPIRNKQMLDEGKPDIVIAFHNDISQSRGTKNMLKQSEKVGIPFKIIKGNEVI